MSNFSINHFFNKFPRLEVDDLVLRDLMLSDSNNYYNYMTDPQVNKYLSDEDIPKSIEGASNEIKFWSGLFYRKQSIFWAIAEKQSNNLIGTIGFNSWSSNNSRGEVSYDLASSYWKRGIMSKALKAVLDFAFTYMNLNRIEAKVMLDNYASIKLLEKYNFRREGILYSYRKIKGSFVDVALYALLKDDNHMLTSK